MSSQLGHPRFERVSRAQRGVVEQHVQGLTLKHPVRLSPDELSLQIVGRIEHRFDLVSTEIEPREEISSPKCSVGHSLLPGLSLFGTEISIPDDRRSCTTFQSIYRTIQ